MFQGLGDLVGGTSGGTKASTGFGKWYSEMQEGKEVEMAADVEAGAGENDGSGLWRFWQGNEKKTDGATQVPLLQGFLSGRRENTTSEADTIVMGLSYRQRFKGFVLALVLSVLFFLLAFVVCLPVIVLRPHKFAFSFTMGSLCFMGSFAMLKGPTKHLRSMLAWDRLPFSLAYVGSMVGTLYSCLIMRSYLSVVIFSCIQLVALAWYFLSFVPGGSQGMKYFLGAISTTVRYTIKPCADICARTICFCMR